MSNNGSHNNGSHASIKSRTGGRVQTATDNRPEQAGACATVDGVTEAKTCPVAGVNWFIKDYIERHSHPVNAALHIVGVPAAFAGFFLFFTGKDIGRGAILIFVGYLMQFLGHQAQGNEVGEVTLMKNVYKRMKRNRI